MFQWKPQSVSGEIGAKGGGCHAPGYVESEVRCLRQDVERLFLIAEALWEILQEKHGYTEEDLIKRIAKIDLRDGKLDGQVAPSQEGPVLCSQCQRPTGRKRPYCIFCGAAVVVKPFER